LFAQNDTNVINSWLHFSDAPNSLNRYFTQEARSTFKCKKRPGFPARNQKRMAAKAIKNKKGYVGGVRSLSCQNTFKPQNDRDF
jgi:hypothetical protein